MFKRTREHYKDPTYTLICENKKLGIEVYLSPCKSIVKTFRGKKIKPDFWINCKKPELATEWIKKYVDGLELRAAECEAEKVRTLEVGDVLVASWGYEQTNIDFYQVIALVGSLSVELRKIAKEKSVDKGLSMSADCVPLLNNFVSDAFVRRVYKGDHATIDNVRYARKLGYVIVGGIKVFNLSRQTEYA